KDFFVGVAKFPAVVIFARNLPEMFRDELHNVKFFGGPGKIRLEAVAKKLKPENPLVKRRVISAPSSASNRKVGKFGKELEQGRRAFNLFIGKAVNLCGPFVNFHFRVDRLDKLSENVSLFIRLDGPDLHDSGLRHPVVTSLLEQAS